MQQERQLVFDAVLARVRGLAHRDAVLGCQEVDSCRVHARHAQGCAPVLARGGDRRGAAVLRAQQHRGQPRAAPPAEVGGKVCVAARRHVEACPVCVTGFPPKLRSRTPAVRCPPPHSQARVFDRAWSAYRA
jgi:hypothetical protein